MIIQARPDIEDASEDLGEEIPEGIEEGVERTLPSLLDTLDDMGWAMERTLQPIADRLVAVADNAMRLMGGAFADRAQELKDKDELGAPGREHDGEPDGRPGDGLGPGLRARGRLPCGPGGPAQREPRARSGCEHDVPGHGCDRPHR